MGKISKGSVGLLVKVLTEPARRQMPKEVDAETKKLRKSLKKLDDGMMKFCKEYPWRKICQETYPKMFGNVRWTDKGKETVDMPWLKKGKFDRWGKYSDKDKSS